MQCEQCLSPQVALLGPTAQLLGVVALLPLPRLPLPQLLQPQPHRRHRLVPVLRLVLVPRLLQVVPAVNLQHRSMLLLLRLLLRLQLLPKGLLPRLPLPVRHALQ